MKTKILMAALLSGAVMTAGMVSAQGARERPDFATLDADGNGSLTMAELQAHGAARFADRDTDGNGTLSAAELAAAGAEKANERAARMIENLDQNADGVLDQTELMARGEDRMERMFERVDADEDGAISEAEFEAVKDGRRGGKGPRRGRG